MVFQLRIRTPQGMKRMVFQSSDATFRDLQLQVQDVTGTPVGQQSLHASPVPQAPPKPLKTNANATLRQLGLSHGDLITDKASTSDAKVVRGAGSFTATPVHTVTSRCKHGPTGKCLHCAGVAPGGIVESAPPCTHGPNTICPNCSKYNKERSKAAADGKEDAPAEWMCTHPDTAFCPKCIPKTESDDPNANRLKCSCDKKRGQQCLHCVENGPVIKVNFVPYKHFVHERRFSHGANADVELPNFKGKPNCNGGHRPWPYGVCLSCAPPNANLRLQKYRHCDSVSFQDVRAVQGFYRDWVRGGTHVQRAGILFGRYEEEPYETKNFGAVRAKVYAIYTPPQKQGAFDIKFLRDPNEKAVIETAKACGLVAVGWVVTTMPRSGDKYGGRVFMSGSEIIQAASFQNRFKDSKSHSRFVTVVIEHGENVEPQAYQVSDQCVALQRDGILKTAEDPFLLATRTAKDKELLPSIVYKDKPLIAGSPFIPDELLVKVIVMAPPNPKPLFRYRQFPDSGGTNANVKTMLSARSKDPLHVMLSDFNLLSYLRGMNVFQPELMQAVCAAVVTGSALSVAQEKSAKDALKLLELL